jgi:hypothetical protein
LNLRGYCVGLVLAMQGVAQCRSCNAELQLLDPADMYGEDLAAGPTEGH